MRDREICVFVIQAEENSSISEKLLSGEQSQVKTTRNVFIQLERVSGDLAAR